MDLATDNLITAPNATSLAPGLERGLANQRAASPASPTVDADIALTPPDPWNEALAQLALAAGRYRDLLASADGAGWPEVTAAHALFLARQRARTLERQLAGPDEARAGQVVCWLA